MIARQSFVPRGFVQSAVVCAGMVAALSASSGCAAPPSPWSSAQQDTVHGFQDPLLDRLVGTWVLSGTMAGGEVVHDLTAEWVTGHQYLRFVELSREREADGTRSYEAIVFIGSDAAQAGYACLWLDSTGGSGLVNGIIGFAPLSDERLAFAFDIGDESIFKTSFIYNASRDTWELRMDSERDGTLKPFTRATMTRQHS